MDCNCFEQYFMQKKPIILKQKKGDQTIASEWNLSMLYDGANDVAIESDICSAEKSFKEFRSKWMERTDWLSDERALNDLLNEENALYSNTDAFRAIQYFSLKKDLDATDSVAESEINLLSDRLSKLLQDGSFVRIKLSKISPEIQKIFLASSMLAQWKYFLKEIFKQGKHLLGQEEENILSRMSLPSRDMWISGTEKMLNVKTVRFGTKRLPIAEAMGLISNLPTKERRGLHGDIMKELGTLAPIAENEINAVYTDKKITDELRSYGAPYSQTILNYENKEETVLRLIKTVTDSFEIAQRFYRVKAKLLKQKTLTYADRSAPIGSIHKKFNIQEGIRILKSSFGLMDEEFGTILDSYLRNGQIDIYPKKGKRGGAYCSSRINMPTYVLLNYTNTKDSVETFAHEMGHAIHSELTMKSQPSLYQGYSTVTAETASTFFERVVEDELMSTLSEHERIIALHDRINGEISTIFRQVACFNFELDLHRHIRTKGFASAQEIGSLLNGHMSKYLGKTVRLTPEDGNFFVSWSHIRNYFYVYSYAYGALVSRALFASYKKDSAFIARVKDFLKAGGSQSPEDIYRKAGIDIDNPDFFKSGLQSIADDITELEKSVRLFTQHKHI